VIEVTDPVATILYEYLWAAGAREKYNGQTKSRSQNGHEQDIEPCT